jgi:membrane protein
MEKRWSTFRIVKEIIRRFREDEVPALGAQMTFYLILSLFPFAIFLLTLMSYTPITTEQITANLVMVMPESAKSIVLGIYRDVMGDSSPTLLSIGMIGSIWAASRGMLSLIRTINKAYDEKERRPYLKVRFLALVYTVLFAVALVIAFAVLVFGGRIGDWLAARTEFASWKPLWSLLKNVLSLFLICALFCLVYLGAPARRIGLREALPGAVFATAGWVAVSALFSIYVSQFANYTRTYGSLGGIIVLLLWLYLSSNILLLGGEINAVLARFRPLSDRKRAGGPEKT